MSRTKTVKLKNARSEHEQTGGKQTKAEKAKDAERKAKPAGYRVVGKDVYRKPTAEDISKGKVYYEARKNRSDEKPSKKFAGGGLIPFQRKFK
jgi:hypothetical protein